MKKYVKGFFKEIIPVIAGILIALWINNWNESRKDRKYVEKVYSSIKKDLTETDRKIDEMMKKQQILADTLNKYKNNKLTLLQVVIKGKGFSAPTVRTSSWKALSNSKIELLEYNKIATLSNIDDGSDLLKLKIQYFMDYLYKNISKTEKEKKEELGLYLSEIMATEKDLKGEIKKIIHE